MCFHEVLLTGFLLPLYTSTFQSVLSLPQNWISVAFVSLSMKAASSYSFLGDFETTFHWLASWIAQVFLQPKKGSMLEDSRSLIKVKSLLERLFAVENKTSASSFTTWMPFSFLPATLPLPRPPFPLLPPQEDRELNPWPLDWSWAATTLATIQSSSQTRNRRSLPPRHRRQLLSLPAGHQSRHIW